MPEPFDYPDDRRIIEFGIGLTDLVKRPTKTIEELKREDFAEGRIVLSQKLEEFAPRVVAFNGKLTYEQFAQRKCNYGLQKGLLYGAQVFVVPSTIGQTARMSRHSETLSQTGAVGGEVRKNASGLHSLSPGAQRENFDEFVITIGSGSRAGDKKRRDRYADDEPARPIECH